jgi:hypothetical protein
MFYCAKSLFTHFSRNEALDWLLAKNEAVMYNIII